MSHDQESRRSVLFKWGLSALALTASQRARGWPAHHAVTSGQPSEEQEGGAGTARAMDFGVASGDPSATAVTLWCRLPQSIACQTGPSEELTLKWQVWVVEAATSLEHRLAAERLREALTSGKKAHDGRMSCVQEGQTTTSPERDFTAHVRAQDLAPGLRYLYFFYMDSQWRSNIGLARTLPHPEESPAEMRFAYLSCQMYSAGFDTAYQALCADPVDYCIHLGDSIYESVGRWNFLIQVRPQPQGTASTLEDYRALHRQALGDPWYREARRLHTFICVPDDHEVANNYSGTDPAYAELQSMGIRAYLDYMPMMGATTADKRLVIPWRQYRMGRLASLLLLNERQWRVSPLQAEQNATEPTLLGEAQRTWLLEQLTQASSPRSGGSDSVSGTSWNVILSETMMMPFSFPRRPRELLESTLDGVFPFSLFADESIEPLGLTNTSDSWQGVPKERQVVLEHLAHLGQANTLVWTGDVHNLVAGQIRLNSAGNSARPVAYEVTTGSISSPGVAEIFRLGTHRLIETHARRINPHIDHLNLKDHMVLICTLTPTHARFESRCPATVRKPSSPWAIVDDITVARGNLQGRVGSPQR